MYTIRKKFTFEMAHILDSSFSVSCQNFHGHSYILEVIISTSSLNRDGMVIDFGKLKEIVKPIIDKFDHSLVIGPYVSRKIQLPSHYKIINTSYNPTAENMCFDIFNQVNIKLSSVIPIFVLKIRLHETETGYAEYTEDIEVTK